MLGVWRKVPESDVRTLEEGAGKRCSEYGSQPVRDEAVAVVLKPATVARGDECRSVRHNFPRSPRPPHRTSRRQTQVVAAGHGISFLAGRGGAFSARSKPIG